MLLWELENRQDRDLNELIGPVIPIVACEEVYVPTRRQLGLTEAYCCSVSACP